MSFDFWTPQVVNYPNYPQASSQPLHAVTATFPRGSVETYSDPMHEQAIKHLRTAAAFIRENASFLEEDGELIKVAETLEAMAMNLKASQINPPYPSDHR